MAYESANMHGSIVTETVGETIPRTPMAGMLLRVAEENARGEGELSFRVDLIGERPAGTLPRSHALVQAASEATRAFGIEPEYTVSSTDANIPLSLGVPAIAIGGGGKSGETHTGKEWFEDTNGASGSLRLLTLLASVAGFRAIHP